MLGALRQHFYRAFARMHSAVVLRTRGRPEHMWFGLRCLVLETRGRRSGNARRVALLYLPQGKDFVVVASNFGGERSPAWHLNLRADPAAVVECRGRRIPVVARELSGHDREETLSLAMAYSKQWREYAATLHRPLPIIRLERASSPEPSARPPSGREVT